MSLSQSTGYLSLNKSITLPVTTASTLGVIFKGADRFIHDYQASGTDGFNTFMGVNSGNFGLSGGVSSEASRNTAYGSSSLINLSTGSGNCAVGMQSLYSTNSGSNNSAFGFGAGSTNTTGSNNTCIGYSAQVPSGTSDNQVRIGDASVTYAGVQVSWTITSDKRWKSNIAQSDLGVEFISKLNPVSYTRRNDERQRVEYGFIAQEIEEILKEAGVENAGMLTVDDAGRYELRYNDLLAPMVKAIQELKAQNDALRNEIVAFRASLAEHVKKEVKAVMLKAFKQEDAKMKVSMNETKN